MKISHLLYFSLSLVAFTSCSQDLEEDFKEQTSEVVPFTFGLKMAQTPQTTTRHNIRSGGHSDSGGSDFAYYLWSTGDKISVSCPESPAGHNHGVYKVSQSEVYQHSGATVELEKISGAMGFDLNKKDETHTVYACYPSDKVTVKEFIPWSNETWTAGALFEASIDANQNGAIEKGQGTEDGYYTVGDWSQAICACAFPTIPSDVISRPADDPTWFIMYPLFTAAEVDLTIPDANCIIEKIELKGQPTRTAGMSICGTASGEFAFQFPEYVQFNEFKTGKEGSVIQDKLTLNISNANEYPLNKGDKLRATLFFFPCGDTDKATGDISVPFNLKIGVTYKVGSKSLFKVTTIENANVSLRGRNHIDLGELPIE